MMNFRPQVEILGERIVPDAGPGTAQNISNLVQYDQQIAPQVFVNSPTHLNSLAQGQPTSTDIVNLNVLVSTSYTTATTSADLIAARIETLWKEVNQLGITRAKLVDQYLVQLQITTSVYNAYLAAYYSLMEQRAAWAARGYADADVEKLTAPARVAMEAALAAYLAENAKLDGLMAQIAPLTAQIAEKMREINYLLWLQQ